MSSFTSGEMLTFADLYSPDKATCSIRAGVISLREAKAFSIRFKSSAVT